MAFVLAVGARWRARVILRLLQTRQLSANPKHGLGCPAGSATSHGWCYRLPRLVGLGRARELVFTGRIIDAHAAQRIGLVSRVVPAAALWEEAQSLAARVTSNSPTAVAQIKRLLRGGNESGAEEIDAFLTCLVNGEGREGMQAFLEKRQPQW